VKHYIAYLNDATCVFKLITSYAKADGVATSVKCTFWYNRGYIAEG